MRKLYKRLTSYQLTIFLVLIVVFIGIILAYLFISDKVTLAADECSAYNDGWTYVNPKTFYKKDITLPEQVETDEEICEYYNVLPKSINNGDVLMFKSIHQNVTVFINNKPVYTCKTEDDGILPMSGNTYNIIPLSQNNAGANIKIVLKTPHKKYKGFINEIYIGDRSSIVYYIAHDDIPSIISVVILFAVSLFLLILFSIFRKMDYSTNILYVFLFSLFLLIYSLPELQIFEFLVPQVTFTNILSYESLMFISIPLLMFFQNQQYGKQKYLIQHSCIFCTYLTFIIFIVNNILHFSRILVLQDTFIVTAISIVVNSIIIIYAAYQMSFHQKSKFMTVLFTIIFLSVPYDIVRYLVSDSVKDSALVTRYALDVFILILISSLIRNTVSLSVLGTKAYKYEQMALHDPLTGVYSRSAFENRAHDIDEHKDELKSAIIMVVDINDLKKVNDLYGHDKGDEYIKDSIEIIYNSFKDVAEVYRTGGDEFAVVSTYHSMFEFEYALRDMKKILYEHNLSSEIPLKFSYGYNIYDNEHDHNLNELFKRSDKDMYRMKFEEKAKQKNLEEQ